MKQSLRNAQRDCIVVPLVVFFIGGFALIGLIGILIFLTVAVLKEKPIEATLVALLSSLSTLCGTAIGSLGSMLNQTRAQEPAHDVTITNPPSDPANVSITPAPGEPTKD